MKLQLLFLLVLIATSLSAQTFEKVDNVVTQTSNSSRAATFVDVDKDGWLDIFITNGKKDGESNVLYMNDGGGNFKSNQSRSVTYDNSPSDGATWGDIDNDGYEDLFVVTWYGEENYLYQNRGKTLSGSSAIKSSGYSETASWGDYDRDGYLDLFITNSSLENGSKNQLYSNNGDGTFTKNTSSQTTETSFNARSVNWVDFDNDNDLDLFVTNENSSNELYLNGTEGFTRVGTGELVSGRTNSTGSSWADYDNDSDLDLYVANFGQINQLFQNNGDGSFSKVLDQDLVKSSDYSFGSAWGDIDNDGDLDLYVANGFDRETGRVSNKLYMNNGDGTFTEDTESVVIAEEGWSYGAAFGDYDNDGSLDLLVANTYEESQTNGLYHNLGNENKWLIIDLEGTASNRSAIGAKVKVTATIGGQVVTQLREISGQSCYNGQNSLRAHFGLGSATSADKIEVIWPTGQSEVYNDQAVDQILKIKETVPEGVLRADFVLSEPAYLTNSDIEITDISMYQEGASVTYEWDFDNDGEVDSTEPSPKVNFPEEGDYSINLMIKSGDQTSEKLKKNYLKTRATILGTEKQNISKQLIVYPNPVSDRLYFKSNFRIEQVDIYTPDGKNIGTRFINDPELKYLEMDSMDLKSGIYTLVLTGNKEKNSIRIIIK